MRRTPAALLAAGLCLSLLATSVWADAEAPSPFLVLPESHPASRAHTWAYAAMAGGAALVGTSFYFTRRADRAYSDYQVATDPDRIESLFDDTTRYDRWSRVSLTSGEVLIAAGLYLRFVRRPAAARAAVAVTPTSCAFFVRF